jgi:hypothetical protein
MVLKKRKEKIFVFKRKNSERKKNIWLDIFVQTNTKSTDC